MLAISRSICVFSLKVSPKVVLICVMLYLVITKSVSDTKLFHVLWHCKRTNVYLNEGFVREQNCMCFDNFATSNFEKLLCWNFCDVSSYRYGGLYGKTDEFLEYMEEICVIKTNLMHCLSSVYFVSQPLHASGVFVAHHQEVYFIQGVTGGTDQNAGGCSLC